jgi:hypothetical protein
MMASGDEPIKFKGLRELNEFLDQLEPKLRNNVIRGALRRGMKPVLLRARANLRSHDRTGKLEKGLRITSRVVKGVPTARVRALGPHGFIGRLLEYGVKAHIIRAKRGGVLEFLGIARRWVQHPGFSGKPWMRPALDSEATNAVLTAATWMKKVLATKHGLDTAGVDVEAE